MLKEAGKGGCKGACQALQLEAGRARQRLEVANRALVSAPAEKNRALLATTLGLPPALLEMVPALLFSTALNGLAFTLLAFGAHTTSPSAEAAPKDPAEPQVSTSQGRAEQVRSFVEAYRKRHGRDPTFSDVRNDLKLPPLHRIGLPAQGARLISGAPRSCNMPRRRHRCAPPGTDYLLVSCPRRR
jgi:hypothetical protein